jgi:hypothetical protein
MAGGETASDGDEGIGGAAGQAVAEEAGGEMGDDLR